MYGFSDIVNMLTQYSIAHAMRSARVWFCEARVMIKELKDL